MEVEVISLPTLLLPLTLPVLHGSEVSGTARSPVGGFPATSWELRQSLRDKKGDSSGGGRISCRRDGSPEGETQTPTQSHG